MSKRMPKEPCGGLTECDYPECGANSPCLMAPADRAPLDVPDEAVRALSNAYEKEAEKLPMWNRNVSTCVAVGLRAALPLMPEYQALLEVAKAAQELIEVDSGTTPDAKLYQPDMALQRAVGNPIVQRLIKPQEQVASQTPPQPGK